MMSKWKIFTYVVAALLTCSLIVDVIAWNFTPNTLVHMCALIIIATKELDEYVDALGKEVDEEWEK